MIGDHTDARSSISRGQATDKIPGVVIDSEFRLQDGPFLKEAPQRSPREIPLEPLYYWKVLFLHLISVLLVSSKTKHVVAFYWEEAQHEDSREQGLGQRRTTGLVMDNVTLGDMFNFSGSRFPRF